jgi:hypothetical protein
VLIIGLAAIISIEEPDNTMSFDFPVTVLQDIQLYAQAEQISAEEALLRLVQKGLKATKRRGKAVASLTDAELAAFDQAFPALDKLDDVTDEQWDRVLKGARRMSHEELSKYA